MLTWKEEILFSEGDEFFSSLLSLIQSAKKTIKIETYIFEQDHLGNRLLSHLQEAANRGVEIKLLLDGAGCSEWDYEDAERFRMKNLEIQFFHPLPWQRKNSRLWTYLNITKVIRGFSLLNHRNHRKVFLIDDEIAFVGSMNITAKHLLSISQNKTWRDTGVLIKGEKIKVLHESFQEAWSFYDNYILRYLRKKKPTSGLPLLFLNRTIRQRRSTYRGLLQRLIHSKTKIYITNPYFIPTTKIRKNLSNAVKRGVSVIAIFPNKSDFFGVKYAMQGTYSSLIKSGIQIFEYQPSMIHAKILITDNHVLIGSSNMNSRSLFLDLEVDVEITHQENIQKINDDFLKDLKSSKQILIDDWNQRSFFDKTMEKIFFWFRWVL